VRAVDVKQHLDEARLCDGDEASRLRAALDWPDGGAILVFRTRIDHEGGARPVEVIEALCGAAPGEEVRFARTALWARGNSEGELADPLDLANVAGKPAPAPPAPPAESPAAAS
jgi:hypothetical protein